MTAVGADGVMMMDRACAGLGTPAGTAPFATAQMHALAEAIVTNGVESVHANRDLWGRIAHTRRVLLLQGVLIAQVRIRFVLNV
jgi:hypothetical protein